jgi:hypothetical protein
MRTSFQILTNVLCIGMFIDRLRTEFLILAPVIFIELKPKFKFCMTAMFHVPKNIVASNVAYFHTRITVDILRIYT